MRKIILALFLLKFLAAADVLLVEEDFIRFKVPKELKKLPTRQENSVLYADNENKPVLIVQTFRGKKWSDWHLKGLEKSTKSLQKFFDNELGGSFGEKVVKAKFDNDTKQLQLNWLQADGTYMLSKMQLTSFGCVAVHVVAGDENGLTAGEKLLKSVTLSIKIPAKYEYVSESIFRQLYASLGGGLYFIILSFIYLVFSLNQRSQMHKRRLQQQFDQRLIERQKSLS